MFEGLAMIPVRMLVTAFGLTIALRPDEVISFLERNSAWRRPNRTARRVRSDRIQGGSVGSVAVVVGTFFVVAGLVLLIKSTLR
jgi:hypothetical protein